MQNLADISMFESIQNKAHQSMGFASLFVFNATFKVIDKKKADTNKQNIEKRKPVFIEEEKFLIKTKPEFQKKKREIEKLEKAGQFPRSLIVDYSNLRIKRIGCRSNLRHWIKEFKEWGIIATSTELDDD
ncbi:MAG: hypothetical protein LBJ67_06255 [Planctomycetaceae bacterium]|nr:hypothetical protein [Planctomycetaceae bacterium]